MYLDLNLAKFQYIDGYGCYHHCLNRFGLELSTGWHKKTVITKNRITSKILFRLTQNFQVCTTKLFHWRSKNVLQMSSRRWRHIDPGGKVLDGIPPLGSLLLLLWLLPSGQGQSRGCCHTPCPKGIPTDKNLGGSNPVNAVTTAGHTCTLLLPCQWFVWRVGGGTMLLERLEDTDDSSSSTKCCPELARHLDISLGVDCHRLLVVVLEPEWLDDASL